MASAFQGDIYKWLITSIWWLNNLDRCINEFAWHVLQNGSHLWQLALQKRKEGRCPLEPGEVAVILRAMGYPKETQIYVASGQVYGGQNRMAPLRNMFPNLVSTTMDSISSNSMISQACSVLTTTFIFKPGNKGGFSRQRGTSNI